jgi:hypothetical protein
MPERERLGYQVRFDRCLISSSYLLGQIPFVSNPNPRGLGRIIKHSRQHRHRTVRYGANEVDRQPSIQTRPAFLPYETAGGMNNPAAWMSLDHPVWGDVVGQGSSLRLQPRPNHLVGIGRNRGEHLGDGGAKKDRRAGQRLIRVSLFGRIEFSERRKAGKGCEESSPAHRLSCSYNGN